MFVALTLSACTPPHFQLWLGFHNGISDDLKEVYMRLSFTIG
jgi:hypothetical protein